MKIHPLNKIKIIGTLLAVVAVGLIVGIKSPGHVTASAGNNVHGWLWSDMPTGSNHVTNSGNLLGGRGLGYVSMNSSDAGMSGDYGVSLDTTTGELSGQGWSEFGGWLDFDAGGPYPPYNAASSAKVMPACWSDASQDTCKVIGWAKFSSGGSAQSGGWDGWVSLNSDSTITPQYHVYYTKSTGQFSGKAWAGTVAGWIGFDNVKADVETLLPDAPLICKDSSGGIHFYTDPLNIPAVCTKLICYQEPGHVAISYQPGDTYPSACIPTNYSVCYSEPGHIGHLYATGTAVPAVCLSTMAPPIIGCMNVCADNYKADAVIDTIPSSCVFPATPKPGCAPKPGGPLTPIYKEN